MFLFYHFQYYSLKAGFIKRISCKNSRFYSQAEKSPGASFVKIKNNFKGDEI